jgi:hypothetical protein
MVKENDRVGENDSGYELFVSSREKALKPKSFPVRRGVYIHSCVAKIAWRYNERKSHGDTLGDSKRIANAGRTMHGGLASANKFAVVFVVGVL